MKMNKLISFWLWVKSFFWGIILAYAVREDYSSISEVIYELRWIYEGNYWKQKKADKPWDD